MSEDGVSESSVDRIEQLDYEAWREYLEEGVLVGQACADCGHVTATPKRACLDCGARELEAVELPVRGEVYSETTINVPPEGFKGSYQVVIVELDDAKLMGRMDGETEIGATVELAGTSTADGFPAVVFEPAD